MPDRRGRGPSTRNTNLDVLRAVAAIGVLAGHAYAFGGRPVPLRAESLGDVVIMQSIVGVWLFFAISGYLITRPYVRALVEGTPLPSPGGYALKRALRIYPAYWIALAVVLVVAGADAAHGWQLPFHFALLHNVVPGREQAILTVAWTLTIEVLFYIAVPIGAWLIRRRHPGPIAPARLASVVALTWLASIVFALGAATAGIDVQGIWLRSVFPARWAMFCPGILLAIASMGLDGSRWKRWLVDLPASPRVRWLVLAALLTGALCASLGPAGFGSDFFVLRELGLQLEAVGFGLVVALALRARPWEERFGKPVVTLGLMSYGIYLYHGVISLVLLEHGGVLLVDHGGVIAWGVHVVELLALTLPVAWLSWHLMERPLIDLSHRPTTRGASGATKDGEPVVIDITGPPEVRKRSLQG